MKKNTGGVIIHTGPIEGDIPAIISIELNGKEIKIGDANVHAVHPIVEGVTNTNILAGILHFKEGSRPDYLPMNIPLKTEWGILYINGPNPPEDEIDPEKLKIGINWNFKFDITTEEKLPKELDMMLR